jgi:hypothetical protein
MKCEDCGKELSCWNEPHSWADCEAYKKVLKKVAMDTFRKNGGSADDTSRL